jgi:cytochrome c-type biogenesis protein CcmH/NrfG
MWNNMTNKKWPILISTLIVAGSLGTYAYMGSYKQVIAQQSSENAIAIQVQQSAQELRIARIDALQEQLYKDKQNGLLWYQLGHAYLLNAEYENAVTVFEYAIRLTQPLTSDHFSSKASALYYANKQQMNSEINTLITQALKIDENNQTALMMLANEQFMQRRYQQAITLWVKVLDSEQAGVNRESIIHRINQAKQFLYQVH